MTKYSASLNQEPYLVSAFSGIRPNLCLKLFHLPLIEVCDNNLHDNNKKNIITQKAKSVKLGRGFQIGAKEPQETCLLLEKMH